MVMVQV